MIYAHEYKQTEIWKYDPSMKKKCNYTERNEAAWELGAKTICFWWHHMYPFVESGVLGASQSADR